MVVGHLFWGTLLILAGISLVFGNIFAFIWPIMKFVLAIILIYKGLTLLFGCNRHGYSIDE